jgi:hypothetical protein
MNHALSKYSLRGRPGPFFLLLSPGATRLGGGPLFLRHVLNGYNFSGLTLHKEEKRHEHDEAKSECRPVQPQTKEEEEQHDCDDEKNEEHCCVVVHLHPYGHIK